MPKRKKLTKEEKISKKIKLSKDKFRLLSKSNNSILGLDLSVLSPGIVVLKNNNYYAYFFPNVQYRHCFKKSQDNFHVEALPVINHSKSLQHRYEQISHQIKNICKHHNVTEVVMEASFAGQGNSTKVLYELGGIIRQDLHRLKIPFQEIHPTKLKLHFTGYGKSKKKDMYNTFINKGFPDLYQLLNVFTSSDKVPTPIQDIVDATALIDSLIK
jgi:Holliday junction resolvasome RuvABC endonuclease subunit